MDRKDLTSNPFTALFPSVSEAQRFSNTTEELLSSNKTPSSIPLPTFTEFENVEDKSAVQDLAKQKIETNSLIENIFLITLDKEPNGAGSRPSCCVYLKDLGEALEDQTWIDMEGLGQAVFERLLIDDARLDVVVLRDNVDNYRTVEEQAGEPHVLKYLYQCFTRLKRIKQADEKTISRFKEIILLNARTCLQQPDLYSHQNIAEQLLDLCLDEMNFVLDSNSDCLAEFFENVVNEIDCHKEDGELLHTFRPVFVLLENKFRDITLMHTEVVRTIDIVTFFARHPRTAEIFMIYSTPMDWNSGRAYESTLLGSMLSFSCIPKNETGPYEFFSNPSATTKQEHDITESNIWQPLSVIAERVYGLLLNMIKLSPDLRHTVMSWIGKCIYANTGRTKIWSNHMPQLFNQMYCSEGFSLNLCMVMLKFCKPFSEPNSPKLLKIQPTYTRAIASDGGHEKEKSIHAKGLNAETCLIPLENTDHLYDDETYNFITECFFLTHQCIQMGFHMVHDKFMKLNQDLHRVQRLYQDVRGQSANEDVEPVRSIKRQMDKGMTLFLSMKAALTVPELLDMSFNFHLATSTWLSQVALFGKVDRFQEIKLPFPATVPDILAVIPECLIGNLTDFTIFLHRFKDEMYEMAGENLNYLMTVIIVFMGSHERMRNPHLRAELAETLSALLPNQEERPGRGLLSNFHKEQLFLNYSLIEYLAETLLNVFVSIELTGQSVAFEQKFNYRRPMYLVLEYIWDIAVHKQSIKKLALVAEEKVDDMDPPLFLKFINLLINDAIFLLDEALSFMSQIKEKQQEKDRGDWNQLNQRQRQEVESNFRQIGMLARYHNVMGNSTIHCLEYLTRDIKSIFCHNTMVDRIAGMLNYFLLHLVGPKQKSFSVKDKNEYEFKPQQIVSDITKIYLNLGESDTFCSAVSGDGRSYSADLFPKATQVLQKIGEHPQVVSDFMMLQDKINNVGQKQKEEEDLLADAPDEFLDPIMGTLMMDPVLLPTSNNIVDRSVIARHILSDQTDPFNRKPLTMNMVVPDVKLKEKIMEWIKAAKKK